MIYTVVSFSDNGFYFSPETEMITLDRKKAINYANELMGAKSIWIDCINVEEWTSETESECILELTRLRR